VHNPAQSVPPNPEQSVPLNERIIHYKICLKKGKDKPIFAPKAETMGSIKRNYN
jgi:hypothetical protein